MSSSSTLPLLRRLAQCLLLLFLVATTRHQQPVTTMALSSPVPVSKQTVAVVGATGNLGRAAVQQLVDQNVACRVLLRHTVDPSVPAPSELTKASSKEQVVAYLASLPGVSIVQGDVSNVDSLKELLQDADSCLALFGATRRSQLSDLWDSSVEDSDPTHAKQINYQGVKNLLEAAKASGGKCRRIVRITGKGEDPTGIFSILINLFGSMAKAWNYEGERVLREQTDIEYTIVRPGIMMSDPEDNKDKDDDQQPLEMLALADDGGDLPVSKIRYADVAALCIASLSYPNAGRSTLTAMTTKEEGGGSTSWLPLLEKVGPDKREFPSNMLQQHKDAVKGAVLKLGAVATVVAAVCVQVLVKAIFA